MEIGSVQQLSSSQHPFFETQRCHELRVKMQVVVPEMLKAVPGAGVEPRAFSDKRILSLIKLDRAVQFSRVHFAGITQFLV